MKRQLASLLVLALCAASPIKAASPTFYDVPSTHWAYEDIQQAAEKGILQGTGTDKNGNRLFEPQSSLTTAQFITIVVRGYYAGQAGSAGDGPWYAPYDQVAQSHGLYQGIQKVDLTATIPRYHMAVILQNILEDLGIALPSGEELQSAAAKISDWKSIPLEYQKAVSVVYASGIIGGMDETGTFAGESSVSRAQAAAIYTRLEIYAEPYIQAAALDYKRQEMLKEINLQRQNAGLSPLSLDERVCDYAQIRAQEITESFSHTRLNGENYWDELGRMGIDYYPGGENIAAGNSTVQATMNQWMNSPGHKANILKEGIGKVGIGYVQVEGGYRHYWVQIFVP